MRPDLHKPPSKMLCTITHKSSWKCFMLQVSLIGLRGAFGNENKILIFIFYWIYYTNNNNTLLPINSLARSKFTKDVYSAWVLVLFRGSLASLRPLNLEGRHFHIHIFFFTWIPIFISNGWGLVLLHFKVIWKFPNL